MIGDWNPLEEAKAPPESVRVLGVELRVGDRVRLCPRKNADIMDMVLAGKVALIEAIEQDFEDNVQLAVVLDDDPGGSSESCASQAIDSSSPRTRWSPHDDIDCLRGQYLPWRRRVRI